MLTAAQLATTIILMCGVTKANFDTPKVQDCVDFYTNCAVADDGNISLKDVIKCEHEWDKKNAKH